MLAQSAINCKFWKDKFSSKFINFCKKSPVLLSMVIKIQDGEEGVLITHMNSNSKYFFPFNFDQNPKDFIADIKRLLVEKHYPRIMEEILEKHQLTADELAQKVEEGIPVDNLAKHEMRVIGTRMYRIDKILAWKQIAILVLEKSSFKDDEIDANYRYKFNGGSLVIFLKNYRSGKYKSLEEASEYFLANSLLIDQLVKKEED